MEGELQNKNESELLFERYLAANGYADWQFEPDIGGQPSRPDYLLPWNGSELLLEVKEMHQEGPPPSGGVHIDPYKRIREKINEARKKFRKLKDWCCSLVLYNVDVRPSTLHIPKVLFGAMLGSWGVIFQRGGRSCTEPAFLDGGKMVRQETREPQNTTISSIIVLHEGPKIHVEFSEREFREDRALGVEGRIESRKRMYDSQGPARKHEPRLRVFENPFARTRLPRDIFKGPYDERWVCELRPPEHCETRRIYVGDALHELEKAEGAR